MFVSRQAPALSMMSGDFSNRIVGSSEQVECTALETRNKVLAWRRAGKFSVFTAGAYDILEINHIAGLVQCRALGAMALLGIDEVTTDEESHLVHATAASDQIRLVVTVDTNTAMKEGKSRRADKGGAPKPTLDWRTRAIMLASQSIPEPDYCRRINLVDFISKHGPECCRSCPNDTCINEDNAEMAVGMRPDMVVVGSESRRTLKDLSCHKERGDLPITRLVSFDEHRGAYHDAILGGKVSTTEIIRRIRS